MHQSAPPVRIPDGTERAQRGIAIAVYLEEQVRCRTCEAPTLARARSVNHVLHLLVSFLLCGSWLFVWGIISVLWSPRWLCSRCGTTCSGPGNPVTRIIGVVCLLVAAVFTVVVGMFVVGALINLSNPPKPTAPEIPTQPAPSEPKEQAKAKPVRQEPKPRPKAVVDPVFTPGPDPTPTPTPSPTPEPEPAPEKPAPTPAKPKATRTPNATITGGEIVPLVIAKQAADLDKYRDLYVFDSAKAKKMVKDGDIVLVSGALPVAVESRARGFAYFRPTEGEHEGKLFVARDKDVIDGAK